MILPILISVSVAPGSYLFCAVAELAIKRQRNAAIAVDWPRLRGEIGIFVLPGIFQSNGHSPSFGFEYAPIRDWCHDAFVGFSFSRIFRNAECKHEFQSEPRAARTVKHAASPTSTIGALPTRLERSMNPAEKALWFIESHLGRELTLDEIAGIAGISRFHMVRSFAAATGLSVMRYVRARRLSEAARALAVGAPDILTLALDADYGSHEAFTRAFRDHFGVTPEAVRAASCVDKLKLQEPIQMDSTVVDTLPVPRF